MNINDVEQRITQAQKARQKRRYRGRYSKMNRCEVCGKFVGDNYWSDERCNTHGYGLVLCRKCCIEVSEIKDEDYDAFFEKLEAKKE